jgi:hypothetical protein
MPAAYNDIYLEQGVTFNTQITLDDNYGNAMNLSGFSVSSQAKRSYFSGTVYLNFTSSIYDASNGIIQLTANSATTANVPAGKLVYDVVLKDTSSNNVTRVVEGQIIVSPGVTGILSSYGVNV